MGLQEVKDDLKKQLEETLKREEEALAEVVPEADKPAEPEPKPAEPAGAVAVEEPKPEIEAKPEKTPAEYAAERREKRALSEQLQAAQERLAALEAKLAAQQATVTQTAEPDKETDPVGWAEHQIKQTNEKLDKIASVTYQQQQENKRREQIEAATNEFVQYENKAREKLKDYDDVRNFYISTMAQSIKVLQPDIDNGKLAEIVRERFLTRAGQLIRSGYENPVEVMYQEAKNLGYRPPAAPEKEEPAPDLKKVAANRARNSGMAAAAGAGDRGDLTPQSAVRLSNAEWSKLPRSEKERILREINS